MTDLEWKEVKPQQTDWERQIDIVGYYGDVVIASLVYYGEEIGWQSVIAGEMNFLNADTEEEAKSEMIDALDSHFEGEINYYSELRESLCELN